MATVPVTAITLSPTVFRGFAQQIIADFLAGDGTTPLDVSGWFAVKLVTSVTVNGYTVDVGTLTLSPSYSAPDSIFTLTAANIATLCGAAILSGPMNLSIQGQHLTGDDFQILGSGTLFEVQPA